MCVGGLEGGRGGGRGEMVKREEAYSIPSATPTHKIHDPLLPPNNMQEIMAHHDFRVCDHCEAEELKVFGDNRPVKCLRICGHKRSYD